MEKQSAFLLITTDKDSREVLDYVQQDKQIKWAANAFGPYQIVAYLETSGKHNLVSSIEALRSKEYITSLDARLVKSIPGDKELSDFIVSDSEVALLQINVDYSQEKERNVTYNLREVPGVVYARAMWGPTDIMAIVEAKDGESMRNLICDDIKIMKGVKSNTTLYCYPASCGPEHRLNEDHTYDRITTKY